MIKLTKTLTRAGALGAAMALAPLSAMAADYSYDYSTASTSSSAAAGGIGVVAIILFVILYIALIAFSLTIWIWMLIDAAKRTNWKQESDKTLWIILIVLLGALGAIIYYFAVKRPLDKDNKPPAPPAAPSK